MNFKFGGITGKKAFPRTGKSLTAAWSVKN